MFRATRSIITERGFFRGIYGGYLTNLAMITPEKMVKLVTNDRLREWFKVQTSTIFIKNLFLTFFPEMIKIILGRKWPGPYSP